MNMLSDAAVVISVLNCAYLITVERKTEQGLTNNYTMRATRITNPESMWEKYASTMNHHVRERTHQSRTNHYYVEENVGERPINGFLPARQELKEWMDMKC